jgi:DNA-binding CsgD family transcriptional regulator
MSELRITDSQAEALRNFIFRLYCRPFDQELAMAACRDLGSLVGAQYHALTFFTSRERARPTIVSNNPPGFMPVYLSVQSQDFLMDSLVSSGREYVLRRDPVMDVPEHQDFILAVQDARPISDIGYFPIKIEGKLRGYWAFGRAGLRNPYYSDDELELLRFGLSFMNDAFERALLPSPLEEDLAYLDYRGNVIAAGGRIREAFGDIFGRGRAPGSDASRPDLAKAFQASYRRYLRGPMAVGMDRLSLRAGDRRFAFIFSRVDPMGRGFRMEGMPFAMARLVDARRAPPKPRPRHATDGGARFDLTPREEEVILGIYGGKSNKEIAQALGIDESTVKRHTHNIYEKTGFRSRVELVLGMPGGPDGLN